MSEIAKSTGTPSENITVDSSTQQSDKKDDESSDTVHISSQYSNIEDEENPLPTSEIESSDIPSKEDFNKSAVILCKSSTPILGASTAIASPKYDSSTSAAEVDFTITFNKEESLEESSSKKEAREIKSDDVKADKFSTKADDVHQAKVTQCNIQAKMDSPKAPVNDESDDKVKKRNYSPIRAPTMSPDKRCSPRITRRDDIVKKRLIVSGAKDAVKIGITTTLPKKVISNTGAVKAVSQLGSKIPVASRVISLASVKRRVQEPVVPEKKKIVLKRRVDSEMGMKKSDKNPKDDDAQPKKKYKPITWP